jgi:hypothetical protein
MAGIPTPKVIAVTDLVGTTRDKGPFVQDLITVIRRTISPPSWFQPDGTGAIGGCYNEKQQQWYLIITNSDDSIVTMVDSLLKQLKTQQ